MLELIKRNRVLFTACAVAMVLVVLLVLRWNNPTRVRFVDEAVQGVAYPFQWTFSKTTGGIGYLFDRYVYLVNLKAENERLQLQNAALKEELNHYINSSVQFNQLREQLQFVEESPERKVFAEVIGESVDNFHHVLLINKGLLAGIRRNFPVVLREGVVGRIQSVTATQAVVELIVDRRHRFPVLIQRSRERLVLQGDGGKLRLKAPDRGIVFGTSTGLQMKRIRMLADVQKGDRVVTSGLAGIFPKGLLVGTVVDVQRQRHELFQTAELRPAVDFNTIEGVFVILRDDNTAEHPMFTSK